MKINDHLQYNNYGKSKAFINNNNGAVDLAQAVRAMNPSFFDPATDAQNKNSFIPDLVYHDELDKVDSLHNAIAHPNSFVPPPVINDPKA